MPYLGGFEHLAPPERQRGGRERLAGFIDHNVAIARYVAPMARRSAAYCRFAVRSAAASRSGSGSTRRLARDFGVPSTMVLL